jgi:ferredoxin
MTVVRVEPGQLQIEVGPDETLMSAAERSGYRWPTVCGGDAACTVCFVRITAGTDCTIPALPAETEALAPVEARYPDAPPGSLRLACQLRLSGGRVGVYKRGVRTTSDLATPTVSISKERRR